MSDRIIEVTADNFERVKKENDRLVIDCWAEWCGPCKMLAPLIEELAERYDGKVTFGKLDCDENRDLVMEHGIMAIPTLLLIKEGEEVDRIVGLVQKDEIEGKLRQLF